MMSTTTATVVSRPRVLVVDDEPAFAEAVAELLEESGFEARPFSDPVEALRGTGADDYDVALLDLAMPGMSGLDLAERVRERSPSTQVVILTGQSDLDSARGGLQVGAFDYLLKSGFNAGAIEGAVRGAAEKARLQREQAELTRQVKEANRLLAALHGLGATDGEHRSLRLVLERLVASAKELTGAAFGRVLLFAPTHSGEGLVIEDAAGDGADPLRGTRLGPAEGIATLAADAGENVRAAQASSHPRYSHRCDEAPAGNPGFLCVPLRSGPVLGALSLAGHRQGEFSRDALTIAQRLAGQAAIQVDNLLSSERSLNFFTHVSEILVSILDSMDVFNRGQARAVATYVDMVTRSLGLPDDKRRDIHYAALLHDIGKTRVPSFLLTAEGLYHSEARAQMQSHCELGVEMLKPITAFAHLLPIIHAHHERWDGKGYPSGLAGEDIPLGARVIAVADAFNAMTHGRPYAPARTPEEALLVLEKGSGTQFDPQIVAVFVAEHRRNQERLPG